MPLIAWDTNPDAVWTGQDAFPAAYETYAPVSQVSEIAPLELGTTLASYGARRSAPMHPTAEAARAFMDLLGGELRPDAAMEDAFATLRARETRPLTVATQRSGPPLAR